jgi:CRP/FNR family transcriptional regulator, anaerobic regulatory protein
VSALEEAAMHAAMQSPGTARIPFMTRDRVHHHALPAAAPGTNCSSCHLRAICLPAGLGEADVRRLDELMFGRRRLKEGQAAYHAGSSFHFLYAVRRGTFKSVMSSKAGREQVTGFRMAGEMMGLDGIAQGTHASGATALEDAEVCVVPYADLARRSAGHAGLQALVLRLMSREIVREHSLMLLLGSMNAEERLAAFLLNLSQRMRARGYSGSEFHLRMTRSDIGSYVGLKLETVSRTFSALQQQGLLGVDKKHVRILDLERFQRIIDLGLQ